MNCLNKLILILCFALPLLGSCEVDDDWDDYYNYEWNSCDQCYDEQFYDENQYFCDKCIEEHSEE